MAEIGEILTRRIGPAPVWVYGGIGVLGIAWWLRRQQAKKAAAQQTQSDSGQPGPLDAYAMAYPMPYSSDTFVNVQNPPPSVPVTINNPPPTVVGSSPPPSTTPVPVATPAAPPKTTSVTYVVQRGDTLWSIAQRFLGAGSKYPTIYAANRTTIEAVARQHGYSSSGSGHWIFSGERLLIPR